MTSVQLIVTITANQGVRTMTTVNHVVEIGAGNHRIVALAGIHIDRLKAAERNRIETTQIDPVVPLTGRDKECLQRRRRERNARLGLSIDPQFNLTGVLWILSDHQFLVTIGKHRQTSIQITPDCRHC